MSLPYGKNELAGLHEFTVTFKDYNAPLPKKPWAEWFGENGMPDYGINPVDKQIIMQCPKPTDCEVVLTDADIANGWTLVWEP